MTRGTSLIELLVGLALALPVLTALTSALGSGTRLLADAGTRAEAEDTVVLAAESFAFDVRRAGHDPTAAGVEALTLASGDRLTLHADVDGDGTVDAASDDVTSYACASGPPRLSRIIGSQSLPLASDVETCRLAYLDAAGVEIDPSGGALAVDDRARVRAVVLELALRPARLRTAATRRTLVALRRTS